MDLENNDFFSSFRGIDLRELIAYIENFDLVYRDSLNLPPWVTFGVEIEYEGIQKRIVDKYIAKNFWDWISKMDGSLNSGGEINSPILHDDKKSWEELKTVCHFLKNKHADTLHNAGGHVHVGAQTLGSDYNRWLYFLKVYTVYESVLYRFFYGDKLSGRSKIKKYAYPMADDLCNKISFFEKENNYKDILIELYQSFSRCAAINFGNVHYVSVDQIKDKNTIEFRIPNGTVEEVVIQNNCNTCIHLLLSFSNVFVDEDFLDYKLMNNKITYQNQFYM